jgi:hypothetical protein
VRKTVSAAQLGDEQGLAARAAAAAAGAPSASIVPASSQQLQLIGAAPAVPAAWQGIQLPVLPAGQQQPAMMQRLSLQLPVVSPPQQQQQPALASQISSLRGLDAVQLELLTQIEAAAKAQVAPLSSATGGGHHIFSESLRQRRLSLALDGAQMDQLQQQQQQLPPRRPRPQHSTSLPADAWPGHASGAAPR